MFSHIKQVFLGLLSFSRSLATKYLSLNNEACIIRSVFTDLNLDDLNYYQFMVSLDKYTESCNVANGLSTKICAPRKTKDINFKAFNLITRKNEAKTIVKHILCGCKWKFNSKTCNSNQKWNIRTYQCECKNYHKCKKIYSWNPSTCTCENSKCLKSIVGDSKIVCDEIIYVMDVVSTNVVNTISINVTSAMSTNCHKKK